MSSYKRPKEEKFTVIMDVSCHCGSGLVFSKCCSAILNGHQAAATAEALMRSRYTAYVLKDADYLLKSWHPSTRPTSLEFDEQQRWLGLRIKASELGGPLDDQGTVTFVARYKIAGKGYRLEETSRFCRSGQDWVYVEALE